MDCSILSHSLMQNPPLQVACAEQVLHAAKVPTHVAQILRKKCGSARKEFLRVWIPEPCSRSNRIYLVVCYHICTLAYVLRFRA